MQLLSLLVELHLHRNKPAVWTVISRIAHDVTHAPRIPCQLRPLVQTLSLRPVYFPCKAKEKLYLEKGARPLVCGPCVAAEEPILALTCSCFPSNPGEIPSTAICVFARSICLHEESVSRRRVLGGMADRSHLPQVNKQPSHLFYNSVSRDPHDRGQLGAELFCWRQFCS